MQVQTASGVKTIDLDALRAELEPGPHTRVEHPGGTSTSLGGCELIDGAYHCRPAARRPESGRQGAQSNSRFPDESEGCCDNAASQNTPQLHEYPLEVATDGTQSEPPASQGTAEPATCPISRLRADEEEPPTEPHIQACHNNMTEKERL